jgi:eukaryotic-like serine/threonine-protein kinase
MVNNLAQIEELFHQALSYDPEERRAYLENACHGDTVMRREVESLVAAYNSNSGLLDQTAVTLAMKVIRSRDDDSMIGEQVGFYRILSCLGRGGMGTVYLAEDLRLNRKVALKFLSTEFISDSWAKRQLIREAQAVAMLDHPNICAVYGFEEIGDYSFIVMQYIDGATLADIIRKGALNSSQIIPLAQQIVSALGNAHAHGIIHRDIKPKNIMVTSAGQVKVLDFGLAKTIPKSLEDATESISQLSRDGLLVGTVAYMSPEQLRGEKVDYRSDIFSTGTVLYEMVSGKNPHAHKSNAEVISAIMSREPQSLRQVSVSCPKGLDQIVGKCLQKDRANRYQSAPELLIDLDNVQRGTPLPVPIHLYLNVRYAAMAAMLLLSLAVGWFVYRSWVGADQTLAILPIVCEGTSSANQCVGPKMTETLVRALSNRRGLRVRRSHVEPSMFGAHASGAQKVAQDLNADIVFYGRIVPGETGLILTANLINVKDGTAIAEEYYPLNLDKTSLVEQQLSLDTAYYLHLPITEDDRNLSSVLAIQQNRNADAVDLYRDGRIYWAIRDGDNLKKAIDSFKSATEKDPLFAKAYAGLADCYVLMNTVAFKALERRDAMKLAESAARQALEIDNNLAEAHNARAAVLMKGHWDWDGAEKEFKRAIMLNPDYAPAHWGYSNLLATTGRFSESIAEGQIAKDLDPLHAPAILNYCRTLYFARQLDQAYPCYDRLTEDFPNFSTGKYAHGIVYALQGRFSEAIPIFQEFYTRDKAHGGAMLGFAYGMANRNAEAQQVLGEMQELQKQQDLPAQELAIIYLGLNDLDHALPLFRQAVEDRYPPSQTIFIDPMFDRLRADPRFADIARDVRLPLRSAASVAATPNTSAK